MALANANWPATHDAARDFWRWWSGELLAVLPARLKRIWRQRSEAHFLDAEATGLILRDVLENLVDATQHSEIGDLPLRLRANQVLVRRIEMPLAAEKSLREALALQLDRLMPLKPELVHFDYKIVARDKAAASLVVDLAVVRKEVIDKLSAEASRRGFTISRIGLVDKGSPCSLRFDFAQHRKRTRTSRASNLIWASVAALVGSLIFVGFALDNYRARERSALKTQLSHALEEGKGVAELRDEVRTILAHQDRLAKKSAAPTLSAMLLELTRLLPEETYVTDLDYGDGSFRLQGFADDASAVLALIESSDLFAGVEFRSPVTRDRKAQKERFDLNFKIQSEIAA